MAIYIFVALLLTLISLYANRFNARSQSMLYVAIGLILITLLVVRDYTVSQDFIVYKKLYDLAPDITLLKKSFSDYNSRLITEFSYSAFCSYLKSTNHSIDTNFIIIFTSYAVLGVIMKLYSIQKLTDLKFLAVFIYFSNLFILQEMAQMRAGIAIGFVLLSIAKLTEEKYLQFFLFILIAGFFHTSAIMAIILIIFKFIKPDAKVWGGIFLVCVIIQIIHFDILKIIDFIPIEFYQYKLKAYIQLQNEEQFVMNYFNVGFIIQNIVILVCFFYKNQLETENKHIGILLNMCCLSSCCFVFFGQIPGFAMRISEVFNCSLIILIPSIVKVMKPKLVAELVVYVIGWGLLLINIFHSHVINEYKTLWS